IDAVGCLLKGVEVGDRALDELDPRVLGGVGNVVLLATDEVVEDADLGRALGQELVDDVGADEPGPADDENLAAFELHRDWLRVVGTSCALSCRVGRVFEAHRPWRSLIGASGGPRKASAHPTTA